MPWAGTKKTPVETNNSPQYLAVRIASETLIPTQLYMNVNESDPRSNVHYSSSSENKAWKKFRPVRDLNPWPLRYRCSVVPTELTSQLGADHYVGSIYIYSHIYIYDFHIFLAAALHIIINLWWLCLSGVILSVHATAPNASRKVKCDHDKSTLNIQYT